MRSLSDQCLFYSPAFLTILLLGLFSAPVHLAGIAFVPNIVWLMSLIVVMVYPAAWPRWLAFVLGMIQDVVFGTPLGSQALLTLLLVELTSAQSRRQSYQQFHVRWLEAAGVLLLWHLMLWVILSITAPYTPAIKPLLAACLASVVWYPIFYASLTRLMGLLPPAK